jgi:hypothetical protein
MLAAPAVREAVDAALVRKDRLPPGPLAIFAALYHAGADGIPEDELVHRVRWDDALSFQRVLQGVTKRIRERATLGATVYRAHIRTRTVGSRLHYLLAPEARAAIDDVDQLRRILQMPVADILATRNPADPQGDKSKWLRL